MGESSTCFGQLPIATAATRGQSGSFETIVPPAGPVLEHMLSAARKKFGPFSIVQAQSLCRGVMHVSGSGAVGVCCQVPQDGLDELVVGRNGHIDCSFRNPEWLTIR